MRRLRLELRRARPSLAVIAAGCAIGLACAAFVALNVSKTLFTKTTEVAFVVDNADGVVPGRQEIRVLGIPAGTITGVRAVAGHAVVTAKLRASLGPIYRDARAALRPSTALQEMYLDVVDRGHPAAGRISARQALPAGRTSRSVDVEDVLDAFHADVRRELRHTLDNLGNGLADRGAALRATFVELAPLLRVAGRVAGELDARAAATARLVHNTATLSEELARRQGALRRLVRSGAVTFRTLQTGSHDLDAILRELPPALSEVDGSLGAVDGIVGDVDRAVHALGPVATELSPGLADLRAVSASARPAVRALEPAVDRLVPLARHLLPAASQLHTAAAALRPQAGSFDRLTRTLAGCKRELQAFIQWTAGLAKFSDSRGAYPRGNLILDLNTAGLTGDPSTRLVGACAPGTAIGGRPARPEDDG